jgi:Resolvase, N terminal domain
LPKSLDAQREACEAYIKSQAHEGWRLTPDRYDDAGLSGASLDRPALQQLLAVVRAGKITIVVVYKVDRLTRSLTDFAKLVELFDQYGVSFVSITQSFNTTCRSFLASGFAGLFASRLMGSQTGHVFATGGRRVRVLRRRLVLGAVPPVLVPILWSGDYRAPDFRSSKAEREGINLDAAPTADPEMAQFVEEDHQAQDEKERQNISSEKPDIRKDRYLNS